MTEGADKTTKGQFGAFVPTVLNECTVLAPRLQKSLRYRTLTFGLEGKAGAGACAVGVGGLQEPRQSTPLDSLAPDTPLRGAAWPGRAPVQDWEPTQPPGAALGQLLEGDQALQQSVTHLALVLETQLQIRDTNK